MTATKEKPGSMPAAPILDIRRISKSFPGVLALDAVDVRFFPGEVHVLLGENGAGKSTLIKVIAGIYRRDAGTVLFRGKSVEFRHPRDAIENGISVVHQELNVLPDLTVAENIFLGQESALGPSRWFNRRRISLAAGEILDQLNASLSPATLAGRLSTAQKQIVELARAIARGASCVIMDEPTSSLSDEEVRALFQVIEQLKREQVAIIYVSHRLREISTVGDRLTVMKDGRVVRTMPMAGATEADMVRLMVGREIKELFPSRRARTGAPIMSVEHLTRAPHFRDVSFSIREGEILGIAGLVGAGRSQLLRSIFAADACDAGKVAIRGKALAQPSPREAIANQLGLVPEERRTQGLLLDQSIEQNVALPSLPRTSTYGLVDRRWEQDTAQHYIAKLGIRTPSASLPVNALSGGNQQKVVLAKWWAADARILLLDEPTRGVDIQAKAEIYSLMDEFVLGGGSIVMASSDLPELLGIADRILVMCHGRVVGCVDRQVATEEQIIAWATSTSNSSAN